MIWSEDRSDRPSNITCGLCGRQLYAEEIAREGMEGRHTPFGLLCGACRTRWQLANEQTIIEHFADRLRRRGHKVQVWIDGRGL